MESLICVHLWMHKCICIVLIWIWLKNLTPSCQRLSGNLVGVSLNCLVLTTITTKSILRIWQFLLAFLVLFVLVVNIPIFQALSCIFWNLNAEIQLITLNTEMTSISCIRCSHWVIYLLDVRFTIDLLYRGLSTSDEALYKQTNKMLMMNHSRSFTGFTGD